MLSRPLLSTTQVADDGFPVQQGRQSQFARRRRCGDECLTCKDGAPFQKVGGKFRERSERKIFFDPPTLSLPGEYRKMNTMVTETLLVFHRFFNTRTWD